MTTQSCSSECLYCDELHNQAQNRCRDAKILALSILLAVMTVFSTYHKSEFGRVVFMTLSIFALSAFAGYFTQNQKISSKAGEILFGVIAIIMFIILIDKLLK